MPSVLKQNVKVTEKNLSSPSITRRLKKLQNLSKGLTFENRN